MATPTVALKARHWVYLDDQRTHEVHSLVHPRAPNDILLNTTEFPAGSRDAAEAIVDERALTTQGQLDLAMRQLEERLALSGTYYRADVQNMQWSLVAPPPAARRIDLRAHEVALPGAATGAKLGFHHFHGDRRDSLLISVPREDLPTRSILAQLEFEFPYADAGELKVLHPRLSPGTLRSSLAREHVELPTRGFAKLIDAPDYERAFGSGWLERTRQTFRLAAARVLSPEEARLLVTSGAVTHGMIPKLAHELIDDIADRGEADLFTAFCDPMSVRSLRFMLGLEDVAVAGDDQRGRAVGHENGFRIAFSRLPQIIGYAIIASTRQYEQGVVGKVVDIYQDKLVLTTGDGFEKKIVDLPRDLKEELKIGYEVSLLPPSLEILEVRPSSEIRDLFLGETPNIKYAQIGGLDETLDRIRDAPAEITLAALVLVILVVIATKAWTGRGTPLRGGLPSGHSALALTSCATNAGAQLDALLDDDAAHRRGDVRALEARGRLIDGDAALLDEVVLFLRLLELLLGGHELRFAVAILLGG